MKYFKQIYFWQLYMLLASKLISAHKRMRLGLEWECRCSRSVKETNEGVLRTVLKHTEKDRFPPTWCHSQGASQTALTGEQNSGYCAK